MESTDSWVTTLVESLGDQLRIGLDHLPGILGATAVLVVGWFLARILRRASHGIANASNRILIRVFPSGIFSNARMSPFVATLVGELVFWSVIFLTVTAAVRIAGLSALSEWLDRIAIYLPNFIVAFVIVVIGYLLSLFVRQHLTPLSRKSLKDDRETVAARFAQGAVIAIALTMALDQVGVDVVLPVSLLVIGAAAIAITFGVCIALGARSYMGNLIGMRSVRGQLTPGLRIRVDGVHGEVLELSSSQILLETEEGKALVPGHVVSECVTTILAPKNDVETDNG